MWYNNKITIILSDKKQNKKKTTGLNLKKCNSDTFLTALQYKWIHFKYCLFKKITNNLFIVYYLNCYHHHHEKTFLLLTDQAKGVLQTNMGHAEDTFTWWNLLEMGEGLPQRCGSLGSSAGAEEANKMQQTNISYSSHLYPQAF